MHADSAFAEMNDTMNTGIFTTIRKGDKAYVVLISETLIFVNAVAVLVFFSLMNRKENFLNFDTIHSFEFLHSTIINIKSTGTNTAVTVSVTITRSLELYCCNWSLLQELSLRDPKNSQI